MAYLRARPIHVLLALLTIILAVTAGVIARQRYQAATAAFVNGERILVAPVERLIDKMKAKDPQRFENEGGAQMEAALRKSMIDARVELRLIGQAARAAGISVSAEDIDRDLKIRASSYKNAAKFYEAMAEEGYTVAILRDEIRDYIAKQKMRVKLARAVRVSDLDVASYIEDGRERLERAEAQFDLTHVTPADFAQGKSLAKGGGSGRLAAGAKKLGLKPDRFWQRAGLIDSDLAGAIAKAGVGGIVGPLPEPDNSLSMYEVHDRRVRQSDGKELQSQVRKMLLRDKQRASFGEWLRSVQSAADVRLF